LSGRDVQYEEGLLNMRRGIQHAERPQDLEERNERDVEEESWDLEGERVVSR
jgi:hypothetical protein